jgi:hypothetical protein
VVRECLEILDDGCEVELVARAGKAPQTHALEAMMDLQVRKAHLDFLALIARLSELRRVLNERARSRAPSLMSRAIFLNGARVHRSLSLQTRQSPGCDK